MHEIDLMQQTLELAIASAKNQGAKQIYQLEMRVGALSGVVPDALTFAFDVLTQGTIAESAQLNIETVAVTCYCPTCQQLFQPPDFIYECPNCHELSHDILSGRELELVSVEVS